MEGVGGSARWGADSEGSEVLSDGESEGEGGGSGSWEGSEVEEEEEMVRAIADFFPERPHEMALRTGQVVVLRRRHPSGWWEGCQSDGAGLVAPLAPTPCPTPPAPQPEWGGAWSPFCRERARPGGRADGQAAGAGASGWFPSNHVLPLPRLRSARARGSRAAREGDSEAGPSHAGAQMPDVDYRNASWAVAARAGGGGRRAAGGVSRGAAGRAGRGPDLAALARLPPGATAQSHARVARGPHSGLTLSDSRRRGRRTTPRPARGAPTRAGRCLAAPRQSRSTRPAARAKRRSRP